ncbi:DUF2332 domain-containing protein [Thalassiella azotivora]
MLDESPVAAGGGAGRDAEAFLRHGEVQRRRGFLLDAAVATALGESGAAQEVLASAPGLLRRPAAVLAALHDLTLGGRAPALARAVAAGDADAAADCAADTLRRLTAEVVDVATRRPVATDEATSRAVLHPALAVAAGRSGAGAVGLVHLGCVAGFTLGVDGVRVTYDNGQVRGHVTSPVRLAARVVGARAVPQHPLPEVAARVGVDRHPFDVTDPDDARWLRACLPLGRSEHVTRLEAEVALLRARPPTLLRGDLLDRLAEAVALVPSRALPVVVTTWAVSRLPVRRRARLPERLLEASDGRALAWVSVEGVGVAPGVPTLGDRPASGHSTVGLTTVANGALRSEVLGRCWSRGRVLSWSAP